MKSFLAFVAVMGAGLGALIFWRKQSAATPQTVSETVSNLVTESVVVVMKTANRITARGIRNNNPGNLEYNSAPGQQWNGLASPPTDGRFCVFVTPDFGFRALGHVLKNYQRDYGIRTVRGIIERWAPPTKNGKYENNTEAYIEAVADYLGVRPDEQINIPDWVGGLAAAITVHENGYNPYPVSDIEVWSRAA